MDKLQIARKVLLSLALIYFATSIIIFTQEVGRTREAIPEVITVIERIKLDSEIPNVITQVFEITREIFLVRQEIPSTLKEVEETRKAIPPILERVDQTNKLIPEILKQVEETPKVIPPILEEVAAVREGLPVSLAKAQKIVSDAKQIHVVGGLTKGFTGAAKEVFTTPFQMLKKGAGKVTGQDK